MKKTIKNLLIMMAAICMASCSDMLEESPKELLSPDKAFSSAQALKLLANVLYDPY